MHIKSYTISMMVLSLTLNCFSSAAYFKAPETKAKTLINQGLLLLFAPFFYVKKI